eukprot:scaffold13147_cov99-Cylindrotheca_fusiformis.AAC.1
MEVYDIYDIDSESRAQETEESEQPSFLRRRRMLSTDDSSSDFQAQYLRKQKGQYHRRLLAEEDKTGRGMELLDSGDIGAAIMERDSSNNNSNNNSNNSGRFDMGTWSISLLILVMVAFVVHKGRSTMRKRNRSADYEYEGVRMNNADLDQLSDDDWGATYM